MKWLSRRNGGRLFVLIALAAAIGFLPGAALHYVLPALSPFLLIAAFLTNPHVDGALLCAAPVLALVLWQRRAFCQYMCPMGLLLDACGKMNSNGPYTYARIPALGYWAALLTFGGAILSIPFFLLFDPIAIFTGAAGSVPPPQNVYRLVYAIEFLTLLVLGLLFPRLWCRRLCPLGGAQDLIADLRRLFRRLARPETPVRASTRLARRAFLGVGAGAAAAALGRSVPWPENPERPLRPPGAAGETMLKALCLRCGACVRSCPEGIIQPSAALSDPAGLLTPVVCLDAGSCLDTCNRCGQHCPSGAIAALSLEQKNKTPIGCAHIDQNACLLQVGRECVSCVLTCKRQAIIERFDKKTFGVTVQADPGICNGCGACLHVCPARAIALRPPKA